MPFSIKVLRVLLDFAGLDPAGAAQPETAMRSIGLADTESMRGLLARTLPPRCPFPCFAAGLLDFLRDREAVERLAGDGVVLDDASVSALRYPEIRRRATGRFLAEFSARHEEGTMDLGPEEAVVADAALAARAVRSGMWRDYAEFAILASEARHWFASAANVYPVSEIQLPAGWRWLRNAREVGDAFDANSRGADALWMEHAELAAGRLAYFMDDANRLGSVRRG